MKEDTTVIVDVSVANLVVFPCLSNFLDVRAHSLFFFSISLERFGNITFGGLT